MEKTHLRGDDRRNLALETSANIESFSVTADEAFDFGRLWDGITTALLAAADLSEMTQRCAYVVIKIVA